ncbi:hypothetical protein AUJ46_02835 [Candidatus Peregrinibacteria bacterium CG1_02_54_53]|nr:MAG: hypothetical protein AUJ46_02835 [Candidatus Peregrinibacteria bacterium CG1_02_54_53]
MKKKMKYKKSGLKPGIGLGAGAPANVKVYAGSTSPAFGGVRMLPDRVTESDMQERQYWSQ